MSESSPLQVRAGTQSGWYYVSTGENLEETADSGLTNAFVNISSADSWVEFGKDNDMNQIKRYGHYAKFKIRAPLSDAGTTKYINWNPVEQDPDDIDYISTMPRTRVDVLDTVKRDLRETIKIPDDSITVGKQIASYPVNVNLAYGCDSQLVV